MSNKIKKKNFFETYLTSIKIRFFFFLIGQLQRKSASLNNVGRKGVTNLILNCERLKTC